MEKPRCDICGYARKPRSMKVNKETTKRECNDCTAYIKQFGKTPSRLTKIRRPEAT